MAVTTMADAQSAEANQALIALGLAGVGVGAGARSLLGLGRFLRSNPPEVAATSSVPTSIPFPMVPRRNPEESEKFAASALDHPLYSTTGIPAAAATAGASLYGGWKLVDWLLDKRNKANQAAQLADAEDEYNTTMRDQFQASLGAKAAADAGNPIPELDELYDAMVTKEAEFADGMTKQAGVGDWLSKNVPGGYAMDKAYQGVSGAYLTALLGTTGLGAYGAYNWTKGRNKEEVLRQALKLRARQRLSPQAIYAMPTEVPLS